MCARFTRAATVDDMALLFQIMEFPEMEPRYNIAPTQTVAAVRIRPERNQREWALLRWGLVPSWAEDLKMGNALINARSETAAEKPAFRSAFRSRRCLIPADGFFEWQKQGAKKQPFHIRMKNAKPFAFAGLWESWKKDEEQTIETFTLLTTSANGVVKPYHDRMPVIVKPEDFEPWLDPSLRDPKIVQPLLKPFADEDMTAIPVSMWVNNPRNQGPTCIEPVPQISDQILPKGEEKPG
ncbi:MAG TPA: SOS response-associated peptidase [Gemmataceae bacterium]|jgi:putative SOS response-associated peptidase YedK|nr:SOS response-associated peptidase [Gemmataceae bacterium]